MKLLGHPTQSAVRRQKDLPAFQHLLPLDQAAANWIIYKSISIFYILRFLLKQ
jgi:hypothetical protein